MTKKKQLTIDDLDYLYEPVTLKHVYEIPVDDNKSICYEIKADKFNLSHKGLMGGISLKKYSKELIVKTSLIKRTQKPKIQTKEDWSITIGKYGHSLLTDKNQPITLDSNREYNYKLKLKNEGIDSTIPHPKFIPANLLNEICAPLDEQLIELYNQLMK